MRVLIFSTVYFPLVGGAEVAMKEITNRIQGVEFDMICAKVKPGLASSERIGNVMVHRIGIGKPIDKLLLPFLGSLKAFTLKGSKEIQVIWSLMASFGGFTALFYTWLRPKVYFVLTLQEGDPLEHYAKRAGIFHSLHKKIFERANAVQAISHFLANWSKKMGFKGEPVVIPNGVTIDEFTNQISIEQRQQLRHTFGIKDGDKILVTTSRLSLKNGVDDLIRSLLFLSPDYKALIIGDGEDKDKLYALVEQKELAERVIFLGHKDHSELPALLQMSDVFVRASLSEGLGISFLEALAAGIPIIGTPVGGIVDFLIEGETGLFCQPRDPESIAKAAEKLMTDPELYRRIQETGITMVKEKYNWDSIANQIKDVLQRHASKY